MIDLKLSGLLSGAAFKVYLVTVSSKSNFPIHRGFASLSAIPTWDGYTKALRWLSGD